MRSAVVHTRLLDGAAAGADLGARILAELEGAPDALIVFASASHDAPALLAALQSACRPRFLIGGTTVGGFTAGAYLDGAVCAVALRSNALRFSASLGGGLTSSRTQAAEELVEGFEGLKTQADLYRAAIVLIDARADHADELVQDLTLRTRGRYQLLGGGTADDMWMMGSHVFLGTEVYTDAAVALEVLSNEPLGVGICHSWAPVGPPMRVTETDGKRLVSLNAVPAADVMEQHARATEQSFDPRQPLAFFLRNLIGIDLGNGFKMRTPLSVLEDGSIQCAAEVPDGATVRIMGTSAELAEKAALDAMRSARRQLGDRRPSTGIFFDCIAARLRKELGYGYDLRGVEGALGTARYAGFSTAGQIVRAEGEFGGFHNSTGVVLLFPD